MATLSGIITPSNVLTATNTQTVTNKTLTNPVINGMTGNTAVINFGSGQFYKDASGNVGIGTSSPGFGSSVGRTYLTLVGTGTGPSGIGVLQLASSTGASVNNGNIEWFDVGNTSSVALRNAFISSGSEGVSANNLGSYIDIATKADGVSGAGSVRMRIDASGNVVFNNNNLTAIKTATFNSQTTIATTSGSITVDWNTAQNQLQTEPTGTITYTFTAPPGPCHLQLIINSDGTSTAQTINWPGTVIQYGSTWAGVNNKRAVINFWYDGTNYQMIGTNQV
jgi:hypothetical protein